MLYGVHELYNTFFALDVRLKEERYSQPFLVANATNHTLLTHRYVPPKGNQSRKGVLVAAYEQLDGSVIRAYESYKHSKQTNAQQQGALEPANIDGVYAMDVHEMPFGRIRRGIGNAARRVGSIVSAGINAVLGAFSRALRRLVPSSLQSVRLPGQNPGCWRGITHDSAFG